MSKVVFALMVGITFLVTGCNETRTPDQVADEALRKLCANQTSAQGCDKLNK